MAIRRERLMAGDERYLLTRDQGPVAATCVTSSTPAATYWGCSCRRRWRAVHHVRRAAASVLYLTGDAVLMALMALDGVILAARSPDGWMEKFRIIPKAVGK